MNVRIDRLLSSPQVKIYRELAQTNGDDSISQNDPSAREKIDLELCADRQQIQSILFDPLEAFTAAWRYGRGLSLCDDSEAKDGSLIKSPKYCAMVLTSALALRCKSPAEDGMASLRGKSADVVDEFMVTIAMLIDTWLEFARGDEPDIRWSLAYPDLTREMQKAQQARITWTQPPNWLVKGTMDRPKLQFVQKIRGQRTFRQAAKTSAYILWGDFMADNAKSIDFCERCRHPFKARSNKRFFPASCGTNESANRKHKSDIREDNREKLIKVSSKLRERLANRRSGDLLKDLATGRWLARFVRAAEIPADTQAREDLLELCIPYGSSETDIRDTTAVFMRFLADLAKCAEARRR